jgi:hypothetical protein
MRWLMMAESFAERSKVSLLTGLRSSCPPQTSSRPVTEAQQRSAEIDYFASAVLDIPTCTLILTAAVAGVTSYIAWQQWQTAKNNFQ